MKKYIILAATVAVFSEINFYPFNSTLRLSAAIIALNLIILIDEEINVFYTCIFSGISIFLQRSLFGLLFHSMSLHDVFFLHGPAIIYYIIYGLLVSILDIPKTKNQFIKAVMFLALSDIVSNIIETTIRQRGSTSYLWGMIVLVGIGRSVFAYLIYIFYKKQEFLLLSREHKKKYAQLNLLVSNIQAELFYLKKSTHDIENVMKKSYALYQESKEDEDLKQKTLKIALEIHEIKKDYYKVLNGFENFLKSFEDDGKMMISDMFTIIKGNTSRYLSENNLDIDITLVYHEDYVVNKYYHLFTILNNLIFNSIDACEGSGSINVLQRSDNNYIVFEVVDNGEGIEDGILPYIFNPGFTTKYDEKSGDSSTGIGLSHVKSMVDELSGEIYVESEIKKGTTFKIILPKDID